jgi:hypothetical protein
LLSSLALGADAIGVAFLLKAGELVVNPHDREPTFNLAKGYS